MALQELYMLGTDPEFLYVTERGSVVAADDVYYDAADQGTEIWGVDTDCGWGELHPKAAKDAEEAVANIRQLITAMKRRKPYRDYDYITGGGETHNDSLGGHIHISFKREGNALSNIRKHTEKLVQILDLFVGIPLREARGGKRDDFGEYGFLGDYHDEQRYPVNAIGIEYRTPPSFLKTPQLYRAVMETVECIVKNYNKMSKYFAEKVKNFNFNHYKREEDDYGDCPPYPHNLCRSNPNGERCRVDCEICQVKYDKVLALMMSKSTKTTSPPSFKDYKEIGLSRGSAIIMANLSTTDIGGKIDIDKWRKYRRRKK